MKTTLSFLLTFIILGFATSNIYSQQPEWKNAPRPEEKIIGVLNDYKEGGSIGKDDFWRKRIEDTRMNLNEEELYKSMLNSAKKKYGEEYPSISLRNFKYAVKDLIPKREYDDLIARYNPQIPSKEYVVTVSCYTTINGIEYNLDYCKLYKLYLMTATVVVPDFSIYLEQAVEKALRNVKNGERLAIDQIIGLNENETELIKDKLVDLLLDGGYKVVAKEYLQKLYEEQKQQQSGVYNEETKVQGNNFSAAGYYINVKVSQTSIRVQVVNVSTGEYEGNATINF